MAETYRMPAVLPLAPFVPQPASFGIGRHAGDTVATYCWVGYRASMTYFIARYLGYPVKLYDGSYQDWQQRKLPVKAGAIP
jgi:3-mercaptopyruvate sulfurtransferase SseA